MKLWISWYRCVEEFQAACSRSRTFFYLVLVLVGFSVRWECAGVTSFIRALCLEPALYTGLLHFFNSSTGLKLSVLTEIWFRQVHRLFPVLQVGSYLVYVADGLKIPKEGKKMPGVKTLYQSSENNSKAAYCMGHSLQVVAVLVCVLGGHVAAVPLTARIHEGIVSFPGDRRSLLDKLATLFLQLVSLDSRPALLVVDAYYASRKILQPLLQEGHQVLTRVRSNAVAYQPAERTQSRFRGRPKLYGEKIKLRRYFQQRDRFLSAPSPVYGETTVTLQYRTETLVWRSIGRLVRFVWVLHPTRGAMILMGTDLSLDPLKLIEVYGYRFKIEVSFRSAIHGMGVYAYHFWMKAMNPIRRNEGNQYLHKKSSAYRKAVMRKMEAYHRFIQLGCIAQGLLQYLSFLYGKEVWKQFRSWMRTMKTTTPPSEKVVSYALRSCLLDFLVNSPREHKLKKIISENMTIDRMKEYQLAA